MEDDKLRQETQSRRRLEFEQDEDLTETNDGESILDSTQANVSREVPKIGMEFETEEAAYEFYNSYALELGLSIRRSKFHIVNGKLLDRVFVCSCEGKRGVDKRDNVYKSHRPETRCGCQAKLKINCRNTCKYRVVNFIAEHNHPLASPSKAHLFRSHRKVTLSQASEVDMSDKAGVAPKRAFDVMALRAGGRESLGFTAIDYKNYLRTKRSLVMKTGDTGGVLEYLQGMQSKDPNFFYAIQVDEDDLITNIFWADARMMADYEDFGDVVCFDTTYRKHKDGRPFAMFVGVNHHKQTSIFGAVLLYDETALTFKWLFDTFSKAMGGKKPQIILTDQDAAMSNALESEWTETYHRLCVWHIFHNAAIHLSHVFSSFKKFSTDFSSCVYDYDNEEDFLNAWNEMLEKYDLQNNDWLKRMFKIKEKWALVYGRDTFCADMTTTQRSESMNKVIKHYVSYKHDLRRFFENFQRLLDDRRYDEMTADFKANQSKISLSFPVEILKHVSSIYTPQVFKLFQDELCKAYDCNIEVCNDNGVHTICTVTPHKKRYIYTVTYDASQETISCTCRKFEFAGMLCSHALKVFSAKGVTKIPDNYILKRWTKGAKKGGSTSSSEKSSDTDPKALMGRRYRDLCRLSTRLVTRAAEKEEASKVVREGLIKLFEEIDLSSIEKPVHSSPSHSHVAKSGIINNVVVSPGGTKKLIRGIKLKAKPERHSGKRIKSALDRARKNRRTRQKTPTYVDEHLGIQRQQVENSSQLTQHNTLGIHMEQVMMPSQLTQHSFYHDPGLHSSFVEHHNPMNISMTQSISPSQVVQGSSSSVPRIHPMYTSKLSNLSNAQTFAQVNNMNILTQQSSLLSSMQYPQLSNQINNYHLADIDYSTAQSFKGQAIEPKQQMNPEVQAQIGKAGTNHLIFGANRQ